jgi:hypothetical protein
VHQQYTVPPRANTVVEDQHRAATAFWALRRRHDTYGATDPPLLDRLRRCTVQAHLQRRLRYARARIVRAAARPGARLDTPR